MTTIEKAIHKEMLEAMPVLKKFIAEMVRDELSIQMDKIKQDSITEELLKKMKLFLEHIQFQMIFKMN